MKKVLIAYTSRTGTTQKMADYLAEGLGTSRPTMDKILNKIEADYMEGL